MPHATVPPWSEKHAYEHAADPPSDGLGFGITAVVAELLVLTGWAVALLADSPTLGRGEWFLVILVLPPLALVCAVLAIERGRRGQTRRHRLALWLGVGAGTPAAAGVVLGLVFLVVEALTGA